MEVGPDRFSPSSFGATFRSFSSTYVWIYVINLSYLEEGRHAEEERFIPEICSLGNARCRLMSREEAPSLVVRDPI